MSTRQDTGKTPKKNASATAALKGTSVMSPSDMRLRNDIVSVIKRIGANYGYDELETPILNTSELLTFKFAEGAELLDEIYSTADRGGRELGLRYDLTVPFARYVAENAKALRFPFKRMEVGKVFRDGPVKGGRAREFTQCDMDVVGDDNPIITACEQMMLMADVFDALGLEDAVICYSSRTLINGILQLVEVNEDKCSEVIRILDKRDKLFEDDFNRLLQEAGLDEKQAKRLDDWMGYTLWDIRSYLAQCSLFDDPKLTNPDFLAGFREIDEISRRLKAAYGDSAEEKFVFTPSLVRGQDYYTGCVFEAFVSDFGSSIAGGGRYDSIIADLFKENANGDEIEQLSSASGLSFGIVPIMYVVKERAEEARDDENADRGTDDIDRLGMTLITCSPDDINSAMRLMRDLRRGCRVELDAQERNVSKKIKAANKARTRYVVVFGEQERTSGEFPIKDLASGKTLTFKVADADKLDDDTLDAMFGENKMQGEEETERQNND